MPGRDPCSSLLVRCLRRARREGWIACTLLGSDASEKSGATDFAVEWRMGKTLASVLSSAQPLHAPLSCCKVPLSAAFLPFVFFGSSLSAVAKQLQGSWAGTAIYLHTGAGLKAARRNLD